MSGTRLAFIVFAVGILLSMVREWSAPVVCLRNVTERHSSNWLLR